MRIHRRKALAGILVALAVGGLIVYLLLFRQSSAVARIEQLGGKVTRHRIVSPLFRWLPSQISAMNWPLFSTSVISVNLDETAVADADLAALKTLEPFTISLRRTKITDGGVKELAGFTKLRVICLDGTPVTDRCLDSLAQLPHLSDVTAPNTAITKVAVQKFMATAPGVSFYPDPRHWPLSRR